MPNKALKSRIYKIPDKVITRINQMINKLKISDGQAKGLQRAQNMVNDRKLTYLQMNKLKHYFENYKGDGNDDEFKLLGGKLGKKWIMDSDLEHDKDSEAKSKDAKMAAGMKNTHQKAKKGVESANPRINSTGSHGGEIDIKNMDSKNIMDNSAIYKSSTNKSMDSKNKVAINQGYKKEIGSMLYLIEYMNKK